MNLSVAPCAGAWIETLVDQIKKQINDVAPCAGAWIETQVQLRGKLRYPVAPCAGAWIETFETFLSGRAVKSGCHFDRPSRFP